ncbi:MAG: transposase [Phycisphaerales bacterium]|nr:transposase [Phycisphaerales bacterium]
MAAHQKNARRLNATTVFLDESGFMLQPLVRRSWAPRGQTPILRCWDRRDRLSVIGGIVVPPSRERHRLSVVFRIHTGNIKTPQATEFLRVLDTHVRGPMVVVQDKLNVHRAAVKRWLAQRPADAPWVMVEWLPPYAPDLICRRISATAVPLSDCATAYAICSTLNRILFIVGLQIRGQHHPRKLFLILDQLSGSRPKNRLKPGSVPEVEASHRSGARIVFDLDPHLGAGGKGARNLDVDVPVVGVLGVLDLGLGLDRSPGILGADPDADCRDLGRGPRRGRDDDIDGRILARDDLALIAGDLGAEGADRLLAQIDDGAGVVLFVLAVFLAGSVIVVVGLGGRGGRGLLLVTPRQGAEGCEGGEHEGGDQQRMGAHRSLLW